MTLDREAAIERVLAPLCALCASYWRVAMSGEVGTCLDPMNPSFEPPTCEHAVKA